MQTRDRSKTLDSRLASLQLRTDPDHQERKTASLDELKSRDDEEYTWRDCGSDLAARIKRMVKEKICERRDQTTKRESTIYYS